MAEVKSFAALDCSLRGLISDLLLIGVGLLLSGAGRFLRVTSRTGRLALPLPLYAIAPKLTRVNFRNEGLKFSN